MSTTTSIHWVKKISAQRHDYIHAPLTVRYHTDGSSIPSEINFYLNDDALCADLVEAINTVAAKHRPQVVAADDEMESAS